MVSVKNAVIIHGYHLPNRLAVDGDSPSNSHFLPWLQTQLIERGILAQTPEFPLFEGSRYEDWQAVFEAQPLTHKTILVAHSMGGGFLARWLSENDTKFDTIILVAPWLDVDSESSDPFFNFKLDPNLPNRAKKFMVFASSDDHARINRSVEFLREKIPNLNVREFDDRKHFRLREMGTREVPELIEEIFGES